MLLLAGGGLANALIAYRLRQLRPDLSITLVDAGERLGGNHTWSFHSTDVTAAQLAWLGSLIGHSWPGYDVRFPGFARTFSGSYHSFDSAQLHRVVSASGVQVVLNARISEVRPDAVSLADGRVLTGEALIDGRGLTECPGLKLGWQKFLGQVVRLDTPHGRCMPLLMDATVAQHDGFRFMYLLPLDEHRLLVEDTCYSDTPALDPDQLRRNIEAYVGERGWCIGAVEREEQGALPIVRGGDFDRFWSSTDPGDAPVARSGVRALLFHHTTGYSLPEAVALADEIAARGDPTSDTLALFIHERARRRWKEQGFYRLLNRVMFRVPGSQRYRVLAHFHRLPEPVIQRFYAGRTTGSDRLRILSWNRGRGHGPLLHRNANRGHGALLQGDQQGPSPVAVIGAGFGGLALAIRLQVAGVRTVLLEARDRPGGRAYVYRQDDFTFDAGPTVITAPNAIEELFTLAGKSMADHVELLPVDPFYRLDWPDGCRLEYNGDTDAVLEQITRINPADADGYRRFLRYSEAVFREGYLELGHVPFQDPWSMVRVLPRLLRLKSHRSVHGVVSDFIRDPHLREAFSFQPLLIGGNPFTVPALYALIHALERRWGVHFPRGGTGALVQAMAELFQSLGGELRTGCAVEEIRVHHGRVRELALAGGEHLPVAAVASNADVVHTYRHLLRGTARGRSQGARLAGRRHGNSLFIVYFGLRRQHPGLTQHTVLFGPRYRALLEDIFDRRVLAEDFSLYLHAPACTDSSLAPPGQAGYYALAPVPNLGGGALDWARTGPVFRDRILAEVEARCLPGLRQDLVTLRTFTPTDFASELNAHHGAAFSLEPLLSQSAWFRVHNRDDRVAGLYFVGAGTHPGAGVPGVIASAKATASLILPDLGVTQTM